MAQKQIGWRKPGGCTVDGGVQIDNFPPGSTYTGRNLQMWGWCHFCQANAWHFFAKANSNSSACPFANRCCNWYLSHPQNTWHPTQTNFYQPKREKASKERCHLLLTLSRELLSGSRRPAFRRSNVFGGPCTPISPSTNNVPLFFSIPVSHPTCHFFVVAFFCHFTPILFYVCRGEY